MTGYFQRLRIKSPFLVGFRRVISKPHLSAWQASLSLMRLKSRIHRAERGEVVAWITRIAHERRLLRSQIMQLSGNDLTMEMAQSLYEEATAICVDLISMPDKKPAARNERIVKLRKSPRLAERLAPVLYHQYLEQKRINNE